MSFWISTSWQIELTFILQIIKWCIKIGWWREWRHTEVSEKHVKNKTDLQAFALPYLKFLFFINWIATCVTLFLWAGILSCTWSICEKNLHYFVTVANFKSYLIIRNFCNGCFFVTVHQSGLLISFFWVNSS